MKSIILSIGCLVLGSVLALSIKASPAAPVMLPQSAGDCGLWGGPFIDVPECGTCESNNRTSKADCELGCMTVYIQADLDACLAEVACKKAAKDNYRQGLREAEQSYQECLLHNPANLCETWLQSAKDTLFQAYQADLIACTESYISSISQANSDYLSCMLNCCKPCIIIDASIKD